MVERCGNRLASFLDETISHEGLTVVRSPFEEVALAEAGFDLGVSATAFHWLNEEPALVKAATLLKPGGGVVIPAFTWHGGLTKSQFSPKLSFLVPIYCGLYTFSNMSMITSRKAMLAITLTMLRSVSVGQITDPRITEADSLFAYKAWSLARPRYMALVGDTGTTAVGWYRLGYCNQCLSNYDDAIRDYRHSMDLHPSRPLKALLYSKMAAIHSRRKQDGSALDDLDSAVANGYLNWLELDSAKDFAHLRGEKRFAVLSQSVYASAYPCMSDPHAREFDFWVGEWDVYVTGTWYYAGHSLVQRISGGCSLLENWDSRSSSGKSINFIDPVGNKWKQSWSGSYKNGNQEFTDGEYRDDAMWFNFVTTNAANQKITGRLIFYNLGNGRVRQLSQSYDDGAKTWTTNYDFTYIRKTS